MRGDEGSKKALKCMCGCIQNNELHQAMQTGTVSSKLIKGIKNLKQYI